MLDSALVEAMSSAMMAAAMTAIEPMAATVTAVKPATASVAAVEPVATSVTAIEPVAASMMAIPSVMPIPTTVMPTVMLGEGGNR